MLERFRAAHTQVLGVSVDSRFSHANWGCDLGGISFPLLADFEPKGEVARRYGLFLDGPGISDRASVWIDTSGIVRYVVSVGPGGERDLAELAALCERLNREFSSGSEESAALAAPPSGTILYVRDHCGFSKAARLAVENLCPNSVEICNVSRDSDAARALQECSGGEVAPCLVLGGEVLLESDAICQRLAEACSPTPSAARE